MADSDSVSAPKRLPQVPRWQSLLRSVALAKDPLPVLDTSLAQFGDTVQLYIGGVQKSVLTQDPGLIQHILQKNHRNYAKSKFTQDFARYVGRGLLTNEGADWLRQRRLIQPGFHRQRVAGLTGLMQDIITETLAPLTAQAATNGGTVIIETHELMTQLTFRIIARSVFSTAFADAELDRVAALMTEIQAFYVRTIRQPYMVPWLRLSGQFRYHDQLTAELRALLSSYIAERRRANEVPGAPAPPDDLLQMLLDVRYEDTGEPMTIERVLDEALILLIAGHETSANALTWLLYLLARHPAEAAAIRAETAAVLSARHPSTVSDASFVFEELPRLGHSLQAVQEAMRLYPPAWMIDRVALADDEYQGLPIPKGTLFSLYIYGLHRTPNHWEQPDQFLPARFAAGKGPRVATTYIPFGGGPRLCIGMQFALTEMQLVTLKLLRHFEIELVTKQPVPTQALITLRPRGDFQLRLRLR